MRSIVEGMLATGELLGTAGPSRTVLAVTVDTRRFDVLSGLGPDLEGCE
jgi:hypothetical protein